MRQDCGGETRAASETHVTRTCTHRRAIELELAFILCPHALPLLAMFPPRLAAVAGPERQCGDIALLRVGCEMFYSRAPRETPCAADAHVGMPCEAAETDGAEVGGCGGGDAAAARVVRRRWVWEPEENSGAGATDGVGDVWSFLTGEASVRWEGVLMAVFFIYLSMMRPIID